MRARGRPPRARGRQADPQGPDRLGADGPLPYPDGSTAVRQVVVHPGAVCIVATTPALYLVRQPREAVEEPALLELPAGKLDKEGETPLECAQRELARRSASRRAIGRELRSFYTSPGSPTRRSTFPGDRALRLKAEPEDDERIEIVEVRWRSSIDDHGCVDAKSLVGLRCCCASRPAAVPAGRPPPEQGRRPPRGSTQHGHDGPSSRCPEVRPSPRFEALVLDFLAHLEFERGLSRNTLAAYRTDLLQFGRFLAERDRDATDGDRARTSPTSSPSWPRGRQRHAAVLDRDRPPEGGLPSVLLPPPAPRGADRRRPGGEAGGAAAREEAPGGAQLRRGPEAARPAARRRADRDPRPRPARGDVRVGASGDRDDLRSTISRRRHRVTGAPRPAEGLEGAPGAGRREGDRRRPRLPALRAPAAGPRADERSSSSTSAAGR